MESKARGVVSDQTPVSIGVMFLVLGAVVGTVVTVTTLSIHLEDLTNRLDRMESKIDKIESMVRNK